MGVRTLSNQARLVLAVLLQDPARWRHGYELAQEAGLKSGTLYPLLIRLEELGALESDWESPAGLGRPPRHVYRLTVHGQELARVHPPGVEALRRAVTT